MLVQFAVENFRSFRDEVLLNLIAFNKIEQHPAHIIGTQAGKNLLRVAALYGANASGKSNLVEAVQFAQKLILRGTRADQAISVAPYKLGAAFQDAPSTFDFTFLYRDVLYSYAFKVTRRRVAEEWLFATLPGKREVRYFERTTSEDGKVTVEFGPSFAGKGKKRGFLEFVAAGTRPNQLFLTEAVERNVEAVLPVIKWFRDVLQIIPAESAYLALGLTALKDRSFAKFLGDLLDAAGTGISGIVPHREILDFEKLVPEMPETVRQEILDAVSEKKSVAIEMSGKRRGRQFTIVADDGGQPTIVELKTRHQTAEGETIEFDFEEESEGTQRLMHLAPLLFNAKAGEKVFFLDELDRRFHPLLSRMFLDAYLASGPDQRGQLVFTTHDTNLLDLDVLRKDEIWFIEKDEAGASHLSSLVEFNVRHDLKIAKGYLQGRFGAIPFIGDIRNLGWVEPDPSPSDQTPSNSHVADVTQETPVGSLG